MPVSVQVKLSSIGAIATTAARAEALALSGALDLIEDAAVPGLSIAGHNPLTGLERRRYGVASARTGDDATATHPLEPSAGASTNVLRAAKDL